MKPKTTGFQKPIKPKPEQGKPVGMAVVTSGQERGMEFAQCSCGGWAEYHQRRSVLDKRIQRHLDRKHGGVGLWL